MGTVADGRLKDPSRGVAEVVDGSTGLDKGLLIRLRGGELDKSTLVSSSLCALSSLAFLSSGIFAFLPPATPGSLTSDPPPLSTSTLALPSSSSKGLLPCLIAQLPAKSESPIIPGPAIITPIPTNAGAACGLTLTLLGCRRKPNLLGRKEDVEGD